VKSIPIVNAPEYRFGPFVLRPAQRELLAGGEPQRLGGRAFDLLLALAERGGQAVSRDELFARAWPGRVVSDDNLKVQVMGLRRLLGSQAITTAPGHGYRLALPVQVVHAAEPAPGAAASARGAAAAALNPSAALIGRDDELAQLLARLQPGHLVTLAGSGGVGKTRLAQAALAEHSRAGSRFADGAVLVELAPLTDPRALPAAVARRLQLPLETDGWSGAELARALATQSLLLALDNCEHIVAAVADIAEALLAQAPGVALLATSQEPLALRGETVLRLGGLALPPAAAEEAAADAATAVDVEAIAASPAVALLALRVRALDAGFALDAHNAAAAARLVRRLDGLPLALELAAARVPMFGLDGVLGRLTQQLPLLSRGARDAPPRQQTLRAALAWSHALLDAPQKAVFRRLGVFADSFTIETAEAVCCAEGDDPWQTLDALHALVDKSLVSAVQAATARGTPGAQPRLRLLATARQFALERLTEAGELNATRTRHADAVRELFERSLIGISDTPLLPWLERLWPELPELRDALRWVSGCCSEPDRERLVPLVALVGAAGPFWTMAGLNREAQHWLDLARPFIDESTPALHAARYWQAVALRTVDPSAPIAEVVAAAQRAQALYRQLGDRFGEYRMLGVQALNAQRMSPPLDDALLVERMRALEDPAWSPAWRSARLRAEGIAFSRAGDWRRYREHFALERARALDAGDEMRSWSATINVAVADMALGQAGQAIADLEPVVQRLREAGYLRWQWRCAAVLMAAYIEAGRFDAAQAAARETVSLVSVALAPDFIGDHLALWATATGAAEDGARLLGWCDEAPRRRGLAERAAHDQHACDRHLGLLAQALPPERIEALRATGRAWSDEEAVQCLMRLARRDRAQSPTLPQGTTAAAR
jgi:predicted ATPase